MKNILVFGDSIAQGEKDSEGGWVQRLSEELDPDEDFFIYNLGISGDTTREVLERFEEELERRRVNDEEPETILIFQVGINDSLYLVEDKKNQVNIQESRQNFEKLILRSKELVDEVVFLGLTPVIESEVTPLAWDSRKSYRYRDVRRYEDAFYDLCSRYNTHFIDLYDSFIDREYDQLLADGIHPNSDGHELIKQLVKEFLEEEKIL